MEITSNPDSLVAKILKVRYFRHTDFMEAKLGSNPSFIWRSILWGRKILQQGTRWRVGNGNQALVMGSNWIPRPSTFRPIYTSALPPNTKVSDLIDLDHHWNLRLIDQHFIKEDAEAIKKITLPRYPQDDELIWHHDKKGQYTVRSGYQAALGLKFGEIPTSSIGGSHGWSMIWNLNLPRKI